MPIEKDFQQMSYPIYKKINTRLIPFGQTGLRIHATREFEALAESGISCRSRLAWFGVQFEMESSRHPRIRTSLASIERSTGIPSAYVMQHLRELERVGALEIEELSRAQLLSRYPKASRLDECLIIEDTGRIEAGPATFLNDESLEWLFAALEEISGYVMREEDWGKLEGESWATGASSKRQQLIPKLSPEARMTLLAWYLFCPIRIMPLPSAVNVRNLLSPGAPGDLADLVWMTGLGEIEIADAILEIDRLKIYIRKGKSLSAEIERLKGLKSQLEKRGSLVLINNQRREEHDPDGKSHH